MFPTRKCIFHLHVKGHVIRTTAEYPFYVEGQGWTIAAKLHVGDQIRTPYGQTVAIDAITDEGEETVAYQMAEGVPPIPCTGLLLGGTLIETADGLKKIEDIKLDDRIVVRRRFDPEQN